VVGQPLTLKWSGFTGKGEVRLDLLDAGAGLTYVTCSMKDDGQFTVPGSFLSTLYRGQPGPVALTLIASESAPFSVKGLQVANAVGFVFQGAGIVLTEPTPPY